MPRICTYTSEWIGSEVLFLTVDLVGFWLSDCVPGLNSLYVSHEIGVAPDTQKSVTYCNHSTPPLGREPNYIGGGAPRLCGRVPAGDIPVKNM